MLHLVAIGQTAWLSMSSVYTSIWSCKYHEIKNIKYLIQFYYLEEIYVFKLYYLKPLLFAL